MTRHRSVAISLAFLALAALPAAAQLLDADGNRLGPGTGMDDPPGTKLLEFKLTTRPQGLAVAGDSFYVMFRPNIYEIDRKTGAVKTTILLTGAPSGYSPFGLGVDLKRNAFIICDSSLSSIMLADMSGKVVSFVSVRPTRSVGAAYDSNRDGYWITSWSNNQLTLYDAKSLPKVIRTISLAAGGPRGRPAPPSAPRTTWSTRRAGTRRRATRLTRPPESCFRAGRWSTRGSTTVRARPGGIAGSRRW